MPIIIIKEKDLVKKAEKLVEYNDYLLIDATSSGQYGKMDRFANVTTMDALKPPNKALTKTSFINDEDDRRKEVLEKYCKGKDFKKAVYAISVMLTENPKINVFIAVKPRVYSKCGKYYKKVFTRILGLSKNDVTYTYDDVKDNKKILKKGISKSSVAEIKVTLKKVNKKAKKH